jgi:hypothetical protein
MFLLRRLRFLINRRRLERELEEEMQFHAEQAGRRFGNVTHWRERSLDEWGWRTLDELTQDIRYAVRGMRRQPAFAVTAFLLLALGVGANTAIFAVVRAAVLASLPVRAASSLVQLGYHDPYDNAFRPNHSEREFETFSATGRTVRDLFGFSQLQEVNAAVNGVAELAQAQAVTPNTFEVLGTGAPLAPSSVVLAHGYWQSRFGGEPSVIGRTITLNSTPFTIVGVLPRGFSGMALGDKPDVFFHAGRAKEVLVRNPAPRWLRVMGRLNSNRSATRLARTSIVPGPGPACRCRRFGRRLRHCSFVSFRLRPVQNPNSGRVSVFRC